MITPAYRDAGRGRRTRDAGETGDTGMFLIVQAAPPSVVATATPDVELAFPTATQSRGEAHEMPVSELTALGMV